MDMRAASAKNLVTKPFGPADLISAIQRVLTEIRALKLEQNRTYLLPEQKRVSSDRGTLMKMHPHLTLGEA